MRIPLNKIYRAFPELDAFPDHECERFVKRARRRVIKWMWLPVISLPISFVLMVGALILIQIAAGAAVTATVQFIDGAIARWMPKSDFSLGEVVVAAAGLMLITLGPWLSFALLRDRILRRTIAKRIEIADCNTCDHSLLGLPLLIEEPRAAVRCPECGATAVLEDIGLTPDDIIAEGSAGSD